MAFNYRQEREKAAEETAGDKWDKARMWQEKIVFCLRAVETIKNPFKHKEDDPDFIYQFGLRFKDREGRNQAIHTTYRISPEMELLLSRFPAPWHAMKWTRYQTRAGSYGYELDQYSEDERVCPCMQPGKITVMPATAPQLPPASVESNLVIPAFEDFPDSYSPEGVPTFYEVNEATKKKLYTGVASLKATFNLPVMLPPEEEWSQAWAEEMLQRLRLQWVAKSAGAAKSAL